MCHEIYYSLVNMREQDDWWCNPRGAAKYVPVDQLGATDACGFIPFIVDAKPKHGSPDFTRGVAFEKLGNRAREGGGVGRVRFHMLEVHDVGFGGWM